MIAATPIQLGHGYTATVHRAAQALLVHGADITGDGVRDVLAENYTDGSAGCGTFRFYAGAQLREAYVQKGCGDTFSAALTSAGLITWRAVFSSKDPKTDGYIHCCWLRWLRTTRRWAHGRLTIIERDVVPTRDVPHQ